MKHSIFLKAAALFMAACCLLTAAACAVGIYVFSQLELYGGGYESFLAQEQEKRAVFLAEELANSFAARNLSNMSSSIAENYGYTTDAEVISAWYGLDPEQWGYTIRNSYDMLLESVPFPEESGPCTAYSFSIDTEYMQLTTESEAHMVYEDDNGQPQFYRWANGPTYQVEVFLSNTALTAYEDIPMHYIRWAEAWRHGIIFLLVGALLFGIVCIVYLCYTAGRSRKSAEIRPGGLNCLPLDLYAAAIGFADYALAVLAIGYMLPMCITDESYLNPGMITLTGLVLLIGILLLLGWLFALTAQLKAPRFYWWHHSITGRLLGLAWKLLRKGLRGIAKGFRWIGRSIRSLYRLLPFAGKRLLILASFFLVFLFALLLLDPGAEGIAVFLLILLSLAFIALFAYDCFCFGTLMKGAKQMADGNLNANISTKYLLGSYKEHAERLNTMADVATVAARRQMQSERMKAELITNVSHDIKTPLTSLINYVDLLQKPHTEEEGQQYLEVLCRQSQRMKKLLEDLIDMSKASTGNMSVEITRLDGAETIHQALGEFSDKLTAAELTPVFRQPETPLHLLADGRLTWRVLSNLLSNTVKYALPGTRVYLDLSQTSGYVQLSIKNISREELNVTADELTERFVRGDTSRNTEGSGLGLNIAKSLMELQHGELELTVDGDLFKVTLRFPSA